MKSMDVGYSRSGFEYFPNGFTINLALIRTTLDQDRARQDLSDALLAIPK
jgi:hypothetical protein